MSYYYVGQIFGHVTPDFEIKIYLANFAISRTVLDVNEVFTQNYASFGTKIYFLNLKYTS